MLKECVIFIAAPTGGSYCFRGFADSSLEAAAQAFQQLPASQHKEVSDSSIVTVVVGGRGSRMPQFDEHNATCPTYRHLAGRVRRYMAENPDKS